MTILDRIVSHKREEIARRQLGHPLPLLESRMAEAAPPRNFEAALTAQSRPAPRVIAEIKRRSPSKGPILPDLVPAHVARLYERSGAAAISVLADNHFFGGSLDDLAEARAAVSIPVLCKEFIVDPYQIYEARLAGADAVLLIAAVLGTADLRDFRALAETLGMAALVEVHNEPELKSAIESGARIVGINNRDLRTFTVTLQTTLSLIRQIPEGITVVSESGIKSIADRELMASVGVDALLVGEGLLTAPDIEAATLEICGLATAQKVQL